MSFDSRSEPVLHENLVLSNDSMQDLEAGIEHFVRISTKAILEQSLSGLGSPGPEISRVYCGEYGFKFSIKLFLPRVLSKHDQHINYAVVVGETCFNPVDAECSAVHKAIQFLESNHMIKIIDFSSRTIEFLETSNTNYLLDNCIDAVRKLVFQLDKIALRSGQLLDCLKNCSKSQHFCRGVNPDLVIYGVILDNLEPLHINLHERSIHLVQEFEAIKKEKFELHSSIEERRQHNHRPGRSNDVVLPSKLLLDLVLSSLGLYDADYTNSSDARGTFLSYCIFEFPYMKNFKYGGRRAIRGYGLSMNEAEEDAAFKALLFIEKNFITHVIDYNHSNLTKTRIEQQKLILLLARTIKLGDSLELMFLDFIQAIEQMRRKFSFDPAMFFSSRLSRQMQDYHFCANSLQEIHEYLAKCFDDLNPHFALLHQSTWKLSSLKINLPV